MLEANFICRPAVAADVLAIRALGRDVNRLHHDAWPGIFTSSPAGDDAHWQGVLSDERNAVCVATMDEEVIGFAAAQIVDDGGVFLQARRHARLLSICVSSGMRGRGIGKLLIAAIEDWSRSSGAVDLSLSVWRFNAGAIRLYQELGYEVRSLSMAKPLHGASGDA